MDALCYLHTLRLSLRPEAGTPPHCPVTSPVGVCVQPTESVPLGSPLSLLPIQRQLSFPTAYQAVPEVDYQGSRGHKPKGSHKDQLKNNPLLSIMRSLQRGQILREIQPRVTTERPHSKSAEARLQAPPPAHFRPASICFLSYI